MSDDYTPTMDEIVERASSSVYESQRRLRAEALRAIAAHDRALREQIADDLRIEALNEDPDTPDMYLWGVRDGLMRGVDIARGDDM